MKRIALLSLVGTLAAGMALAMGHADVLADLDTDGDGLISADELTVLMPDLTEEDFAALDANADGSLDLEELGAGMDAGLVMMAE